MNNPRSAQISFFSGAPVRGGYDIPVWKWAYTTTIPRPPIPTYAVESKLDLLRLLGLAVPAGQLPQITLTEPEVRVAAEWCRTAGVDGSTKVVGIVPITRQSSRRWPKRYFDELMDRLRSLPGMPSLTFILFWGGPQEEIYVSELVQGKAGRLMIPSLTVKEMAYVLSRCDVVVGNDNGPMHLAVSVGTPTLGIYGPTCVGSWNPRRPPHRHLQLESLGCVGCNHNRCPYGHECMEWMSPQRVSDVVSQMLASGKPASRSA